ncbi:uncharacterized protein LTR77_008271 [Saxophila tyrrhenica]|uniref:asparaginase n=1 Tax=Saxophila tyrrhenica TaxID=1690608 RepID=A0AAV9P2T5_9PEZI|nr:hypothetical protein LTR77_008271 [Saxophila tyrrhenica]
MAQGLNGTDGNDEAHVLLIITGGTICMQDSPDGLVPTRDFAHNCLRPHPDFNEDSSVWESTEVRDEHGGSAFADTLRAPPRTPALGSYKYSVFEFSDLIDSSSIDGSHWSLIMRCLTSNWDQFDAFVVLHGTDTLAYTASALAFMLGPLDKTVLVTGSQLSMYAPHSDAHDNLLDSMTIAASYKVSEVSVVFHHHLYRATRVTKVSAFSVAGFTTPNAKPLASFQRHIGRPWSVFVHSDSIRPADRSRIAHSKYASIRSDSGPTKLDTSRVAVLKVYPGISIGLISSIVQIPNLGGLVLETFGAGNIPLSNGSKGLLEILADAVERGLVIVSVTQCLTGSVTTAYESARRMERKGIVTGLDMTTEAAYTKLVYLLSRESLGPQDVANKMREDLQGELTADFREEQRMKDMIQE